MNSLNSRTSLPGDPKTFNNIFREYCTLIYLKTFRTQKLVDYKRGSSLPMQLSPLYDT
jgi:hypothetical protein